MAVQATIDELGTPLREATFVVVDLETTGGPAEDCGITEIGAVKVRGGEVLGEFQTLVDPGAPIPPFIAVLTGITDRLVTGAPRLEAVLPAFLEFARGAVLVAHNAPFDIGFLKAACARVGLPWPDPPVLDTARLARHVVAGDEVPNHKLGTLAAAVPVAGHTRPPGADRRPRDGRRAARPDGAGRQPRRPVAGGADRVQLPRPAGDPPQADLASGLPHAPGVYVFLDARDRLLYVGTLGRHRARVRSYFTAAETRARMAEMVALAQTVRPIVCATPLEAEVRELRLIAEHAPPYNRRSRFPDRSGWVKLTVEAFPRLSVVRQVLPDGASYIGPFAGAGQAELAVAALHETFPLRQCGGRLPQVPPPGARACLLADLGRCGAPCVGGQGVGEYGRIAAAARSAMAGDARVVVAALLSRAGSLARAQRFEEAGVARDRLLAFLRAAGRAQRLAPLATTPELVAARRAGDGGWELVLIRHGRLAGAATSPAGRDPRPVIAALRATGEHVAPGSAAPPMPAALAEETEQVLRWLEQPGVRLVELDGEWAVPLHGAVGARSRLPPEIVVPEQLWGELPAARARPRGRSRSAR